MTNFDLVREYVSGSEEFLDHVLWSCTAFPFCDETTLRKQLREVQDQVEHGIDPFVKAWRELTEIHEKAKAQIRAEEEKWNLPSR